MDSREDEFYEDGETPEPNVFGAVGFLLALFGLVFFWVSPASLVLWALGAIVSLLGAFRTPRGFALFGLGVSCLSIVFSFYFLGEKSFVGKIFSPTEIRESSEKISESEKNSERSAEAKKVSTTKKPQPANPRSRETTTARKAPTARSRRKAKRRRTARSSRRRERLRTISTQRVQTTRTRTTRSRRCPWGNFRKFPATEQPGPAPCGFGFHASSRSRTTRRRKSSGKC